MWFFAYSSAIIAVLFAIINTVSGNTFGTTVEYYYGNTTATFATYNLDVADNVVSNPTFWFNRTSVLFIHGCLQSSSSNYTQAVIDAYITNGNYNILILNWGKTASLDVSIILSGVDELGREVALFVDRMNRRGVSFAKVHIVGHSMGANIAAAAGKHTFQWSGKTKYIERITCLDPGACYPHPPVNDQYARFVDIIHTDAGGIGTTQNSGHVDFWPNSGKRYQPGCTTTPTTSHQIACSHARALLYWNESVKRKDHVSFLSVNQANPAMMIQMGNNCPTNARGIYSLTTNDGTTWFSKS